MTKGTKLIAEHDGQIFTRVTDRTPENLYTNVVIGYPKEGNPNYVGDDANKWHALNWASSPCLANKAAKRHSSRVYREIFIISCRVA